MELINSITDNSTDTTLHVRQVENAGVWKQKYKCDHCLVTY